MRRLLAATALVSAAAIAYEILLMRVLSIVQWHHFAWMVISLALLGYGASGSFIALTRDRLASRFEGSFAASALLFSLTMVVCLLLGQHVPFNALEVVWSPVQLLYLAVLYLMFMVPFFFAAGCIGLSFTFRSSWLEKIYFSDLLGAGIGALGVITALYLLRPGQAALLLAAVALAASLLVPGVARRRWLAGGQTAWLAILALLALQGGLPGLKISEYKGLSQALEAVGSRVVAESSSPLGLLTVVENTRIPYRHAPGLSFAARHLPPEQLAVFTDGEGLSALNRHDGTPEALAYLDDTTAALPYRLLEQPAVLVLGAGAGSDVALALRQGARRVDAVELNPQMTALVAERCADYAGHLYADPRVRLHTGEARGFTARTERRFDLIQIGLLDSFGVAGSGVQALNENYLYTVEAMSRYLQLLEPGGLLAMTRWLRVPPRDSLKLAATAIEALRRNGVADPGTQLAAIRSWNTFTLLVRNGPFGVEDSARIADFAHGLSFDSVWFPSMQRAEANRFPGIHRALQVSADTGGRRPPVFFPFFQMGGAAGGVVLARARRRRPDRMGLPGPGGDAAAGSNCRLAADPAAAEKVDAALAPRPGPALGRLFLPAGSGVPVHRDGLHPEVHPVPEPPALLDHRRAGRVPALRRARQRRLRWRGTAPGH